MYSILNQVASTKKRTTDKEVRDRYRLVGERSDRFVTKNGVLRATMHCFLGLFVFSHDSLSGFCISLLIAIC